MTSEVEPFVADDAPSDAGREHSSPDGSRPAVPHGEPRGYQHYGCRCEDCRLAYRAYKRDWYAAKDKPAKPPELLVVEMPWKSEAACIGLDPNMFHPIRNEIGSGQAAKAVCARCPVRQECLDYAVTRPEKLGIWGGLNEKERRPLRRALRAAS